MLSVDRRAFSVQRVGEVLLNYQGRFRVRTRARFIEHGPPGSGAIIKSHGKIVLERDGPSLAQLSADRLHERDCHVVVGNSAREVAAVRFGGTDVPERG
jgi:hypothetical protein